MHDILSQIEGTDQKRKTRVFSLLLGAYITVLMLLGSVGDAGYQSVMYADPIAMLWIQGGGSVLIFIIIPILFVWGVLRLRLLFFFQRTTVKAIMLILLTTACFMIINSAVGEWNMKVKFPVEAFDQWARRSEDHLRLLTEHITSFTSTGHFVLAFFVLAVIPGIGEELLFRGLVQNVLIRVFSSHHAAIWVTGFLFSVVHMQFFGLVPRMFLGAIFGYFYFWSSNLSLAMIAHALNNGLALLLLYFYQQGTLKITQEQMGSSAPWPAVVVCGVICIWLIRRFYLECERGNA